jgi:hypothetical protein
LTTDDPKMIAPQEHIRHECRSMVLTPGKHLLAAIHNYRKTTKNITRLIIFVKEFLCVLCVSAVRMVFMDTDISSRTPLE